jgi:hypothetical protein
MDMIVALRASGLEHVLRVRTLGNGDKMLCRAGSKSSSLMIVLSGAAVGTQDDTSQEDQAED